MDVTIRILGRPDPEELREIGDRALTRFLTRRDRPATDEYIATGALLLAIEKTESCPPDAR